MDMRSDEAPSPPIRQRGFFEVRWRQFRRAPRPVVRAVIVSLVVAVVAGLLYLAYDVALTRRFVVGGDLRTPFLTAYVMVVLLAGAVGTYLAVPQPTGAGGRPRRTAWSAALGLLAAIPIAYLVLVVLLQVVRPVLFG